MLETLMRLYVMAMAHGVRSPMPHMFGPPGCGKSTAAEQLAELLGVNLHILNVARISPLEVEGVQMPVDHVDGMKLNMLTATFWTQLKEGDIVLLDEFLRGFPEVYNALLDILTSRRAGGFVLPKVFIIGASNSTVAYDKALEDRLLHLPVGDPRSSRKVKAQLGRLIQQAIGLHPDTVKSREMKSLLDTEVLPMYEILDQIKGRSSAGNSLRGTSPRKLIGQAQLRCVQSDHLHELMVMNNATAMREAKAQYVILLDGDPGSIPSGYKQAAIKLLQGDKLTELQRTNTQLNLQLIEMESVRNYKEGADDDDDFFIDDDAPF